MPSILSRYATPLITGLFVVSLVSGVALFFHYGTAYFHSMHEWLSMVLIAPFVLHIWKNWRSFLTYFKRPAMAVTLVASLAASAIFVVPVMSSAGSGGGRPDMVVLSAVQNAPIAAIAPVFGHDADSFAKALRSKGFTVVSADQSLLDVAAASGKSTRDVMFALPRR
ncbi:MAG: DUF4405 domain-containing protein [Salaquimonas sp.]|jgi:hypothetical protein|nr:DUF4405 domain-containing protein [Salaquimonas sp.]